MANGARNESVRNDKAGTLSAGGDQSKITSAGGDRPDKTPAGERPGNDAALLGRTMTSPMLKAMTHPLRRRIMSVLAGQDYARAADLAEQLGVPANKLSYHLRILADADMIHEAPQFARDKRDRVWQSVDGSLQIGSPEEPLTDDDELALGAYLSQMELEQHNALSRVLAWAPNYATGRDENAKAELAVGTVRLTPAEALELFTSVVRLVKDAGKKYRDPGDQDAHTWEYTFMALREDL